MQPEMLRLYMMQGSLLDSNLMPVPLLTVKVLAVMDGTKFEEAEA